VLGKDILVGIIDVFWIRKIGKDRGKGIKRQKIIFGTFIYENKGN